MGTQFRGFKALEEWKIGLKLNFVGSKRLGNVGKGALKLGIGAGAGDGDWSYILGQTSLSGVGSCQKS